jgi:hypothetical protein
MPDRATQYSNQLASQITAISTGFFNSIDPQLKIFGTAHLVGTNKGGYKNSSPQK